MCLLTWKSNKVVTTGAHAFTPTGSLPSVHGGRGQQKLVTDWGVLFLVQVPPSAHRGRGWLVGTEFTMAVPPLLHHSTVISCFQGRPRFLQEHFWLQSSSHLSPQVVPEQLSSSFPFLFLQECWLSLHSQQQSFPWVFSLKPTLQHPTPASIGGHLSRAGTPRSVAQTTHVSLSVS